MGSYRRGQEDSGDVDILITRDPSDGLTHAGVLQSLVNVLKLNGFITHDVSAEEVKSSDVSRSSRCRMNGKLWRQNGWECAVSDPLRNIDDWVSPVLGHVPY